MGLITTKEQNSLVHKGYILETKGIEKCSPHFDHHAVDIRDRAKRKYSSLFVEIKPDAIVHTAAQPSHDKAAEIPCEDFDVNAVGTLNLLEATT